MQPGHPARHASTPLHHLSCPCLSAGLAKGGKLKREKTQREETESTLHRVLSFPGLWARKELRCPLAEFCWMNRSRVHTHTHTARSGGQKAPKTPQLLSFLIFKPDTLRTCKNLAKPAAVPSIPKQPAIRAPRMHRGCPQPSEDAEPPGTAF